MLFAALARLRAARRLGLYAVAAALPEREGFR
jgi:hypothetical protein